MKFESMAEHWKSPDGKQAIIPLQRGDGKEPNYWGEYRDHKIHLSRESRKKDWYIWVYTPSGALAYDGYWRDSAGKPIREAVAEAIRGAQIEEPGRNRND